MNKKLGSRGQWGPDDRPLKAGVGSGTSLGAVLATKGFSREGKS